MTNIVQLIIAAVIHLKITSMKCDLLLSCRAENIWFQVETQVYIGCQRSISLWDIRAWAARLLLLLLMQYRYQSFFPFSNDITNWNDFCIFDEQKSIVAPSSMHSNCHLFVRVVFTSISNRNKNSSLNYRWIPVKKRQTDSKTASMLNQNEIEANQYMRPLEIFRQIMHFDGINMVRLVIKPHKILIQSASYTRMGVQTIVKLS